MTRSTLKLPPAAPAKAPTTAARTRPTTVRAPAAPARATTTALRRSAASPQPASARATPRAPDKRVARPQGAAAPAPRPRPRPPEVQADTGERLSKKVMQLKNCSRTEAEQYIEGGWVQVNGVVVEAPQHRVDRQTITIDPHASLMELTPVTLVLHKPAGHTDGLDALPAAPSPNGSAHTATARRAPPAAGRRSTALPPNARVLLTPAQHWADDPSGTRVLQRHFRHLEADVALETGASGLVVFTQDWRSTRKLHDDMGTMEHEFLVEVEGAIGPEALHPIAHALKDARLQLPQVKVSVNSTTPQSSRLRFAVKGAHPGLMAFLCDKAGLHILTMKRIRLGRVTLADLPVGQWRYLAGWEKF